MACPFPLHGPARLAASVAALLVSLLPAVPTAKAQQQAVLAEVRVPALPITPVLPIVPEDHTPRGALWRAAAVPGWGQVYNGQYLKLPFVYAGLGGAVYLAVHLTDEYVLYRRATRFAQSEDDFPQFEDEYQVLLDRFGVESIQWTTLRAQRDNLRRNRDLSLLGVGLVYALTVLDAYVSAHLLDFDVDEDLTVGVRPASAGLGAGLRLAL